MLRYPLSPASKLMEPAGNDVCEGSWLHHCFVTARSVQENFSRHHMTLQWMKNGYLYCAQILRRLIQTCPHKVKREALKRQGDRLHQGMSGEEQLEVAGAINQHVGIRSRPYVIRGLCTCSLSFSSAAALDCNSCSDVMAVWKTLKSAVSRKATAGLRCCVIVRPGVG